MYKIPANTLFVGKKLIYVPQCHSTNTLANQLSQTSILPEGAVIITDDQTAGRGQRGNSWESNPYENLTLSIYLKPAFLLPKNQFYLNIITSLAIHDILPDKTSAIKRIKWPNDILVDSKKVCGILIENQIRGAQVSSSVVGVGLNVNQQHFGVPTATSLASIFNREFSLEDILHELLQALERRYLQLRQEAYLSLKTEYISKLFWHDDEHQFQAAGGPVFKGKITGIDEDGRLLINSEAGLQRFGIKEIVYIH